jgi:sugar O-acyltransferase (sialic acid O-acetyltransferase NeuD family)
MSDMSKILIFGTSSFSLLMKNYIERFSRDSVIGFVCDKEYKKSDSFAYLPVYALEEIRRYHSPDDVKVLPAIGYTNMNTMRSQIVDKVRNAGFKFAGFVHPDANWYGEKIGEGNIILEGSSFGLNCVLGDFNIFFNSCAIAHDCIIGSFNHFSPSVALSGCVNVGDYCFVGTNSTLRDNIKVEDYSLIGAGAYISKPTKKYSVTIPAPGVTLVGKTSMDIKTLNFQKE